jgi:hypothetical protein
MRQFLRLVSLDDRITPTSIAFYDGGDQGGPGLANGAKFQAAAQQHSDLAVNAANFDAIIEQLHAYTYGGFTPVDRITILDHGDSTGGQMFGNDYLTQSQISQLAQYLTPDGVIVFAGCQAGAAAGFLHEAANNTGHTVVGSTSDVLIEAGTNAVSGTWVVVTPSETPRLSSISDLGIIEYVYGSTVFNQSGC